MSMMHGIPPNIRPVVAKSMSFGVVAALFYWAWRDVPPAALTAAIGRWGWPQWLVFIAANLAVLGAMNWRWWIILRRMGHPVGFASLVRYRMAANTLSYLTPGPQFGGEPLQVVGLLRGHHVPREAASASVAVDRLAELMGNLLFLSLGGLCVLPSLTSNRFALYATAGLMMGVVMAVGVGFYGIARGRTPFSRMAARVVRHAGASARVIALTAFLEKGERHAASVLTQGLAGWYAGLGGVQISAFLAELWLIYAFLGISLSAQALLTTAVAARLAFLLPLPGGLGALEAGQMLALTSLGGDPVVAAAACGIMRLRDIATISTGGLFMVFGLRAPLGKRPRRWPGRRKAAVDGAPSRP